MLGEIRRDLAMVLMNTCSYNPLERTYWRITAQLLTMWQNLSSHCVESADGLERLLLHLVNFLLDLTTQERPHYRFKLN